MFALRCFLLIIVLHLYVGSTAVNAQTPVESAGTFLKSDTLSKTPDGATFIAPKGWSIETRGNAVILTAEGDSKIALVDLDSNDADAAVNAAWKILRSKATWPLKVATDSPGRDGWDSFRTYRYEVPPNEHRTAIAWTSKRGDAFTVVVIDMDRAVLEKRSGELAKVLDRLQPPGFQRESFAGMTAHPLDAHRIGLMKDFVESGRKQFGIPGVAIGLYQSGDVVFAGGFGVRELGNPAPVDAQTLFMIASNTKSMTTLLLATLVEEGKLTWETPVTNVMSDFKLGDPQTTKQVRIEHLVCACTGLPRQDFEWLFEFDKQTPRSAVGLLESMQPTSEFGEMFQYSNLLASAGGFVAAHAIFPNRELGAAYDDAMSQRVFRPLGMKATTFSFEVALSGNYAAPHSWNIDAKPSPVSMQLNHSVRPVRPAGGAWSNVNDMLKYLRMELNKGVLPNGERLASAVNVVKRRETQVMIGNDTSYGMGLMVERRWGIPVVHHGGSMFGYKSDMIYLPDHDVAAVILTNSDEGTHLLDPFRRRLLEILFDGAPEAEESVASVAKNVRTSVLEERKRLTVPADVVEDSIASRYTNDSLGTIDITVEEKETWFDFGEWKSPVASRRNDDDTVSLVTTLPSFSGLNFLIGKQDNKRTLTLRDSQHEYVFVESN